MSTGAEMQARYGAPVLLTALMVIGSACGRAGDAAINNTVSTLDPGVSVTPAPTVLAEAVTAAPPAEITYVIQPGDSLSVVAQRFGVSLRELADFNAISDPNSIKEGQELRIPPVLNAAVTVQDTTTTAG
ncbi:MAG: LysM domain-containing protein [Acidimicrobiales bacterium]